MSFASLANALAAAVGLAVISAEAAHSLPPAEAGSTACSCIDWWTTEHLRVGHPNVLDRKDRTTMRFELTPYLAAGKVSRAVLNLSLGFYGITNANGFVVHRLVRDREEIRPVDTLSTDVEELGRFVIRAGDGNPSRQRIDVTEAVNALLGSGHVQFVVRVRDATAEKRGNPGHRPEGANLVKDELKLEIEP